MPTFHESGPAARFALHLDGDEIARFDELAIGDAGAAAGRGLLAHELAHTVQQRAGRGAACVALRRGRIQQAALARLRTAPGSRVRVVALSAGKPGPGIDLLGVKVGRSVGMAKGTDVAMEELVLVAEGLD